MSEKKEWRARLKEMGKEAYEIEEMVRMGFLTINEEELERISTKEKEYRKLLARDREIGKELEGLEDITPYIKIIREERIERVRKEREQKKIEKVKAEEIRKAEVADRLRSTPTYLGEDISKDINYEAKENQLLAGLPLIENLDQLAANSEIEAKCWQWLAFHRKVSTIDHYTRFSIPKKSGGKRSISSPKGKMRKAQAWINQNVLAQISLHDSAMAYRPKLSIADNARLHQDSELVIRMDLKDFFPSIEFGRVKGLFQSFGYNPAIASVFASVCTDAERIAVQFDDKKKFVALGKKAVPQGACTSPALTNILCRKLDKRLHNLAAKQEIVYTRYADDLVFSSKNGKINIKSFIAWVHHIVKNEGFVINQKKTHVMRKNQRQSVTGVIVNEEHEIRVSRKDIRNYRAFVHRLHHIGEEAMRIEIGRSPYHYLKGYWSFVKMINPQQAEKLKAYILKFHEGKIKF